MCGAGRLHTALERCRGEWLTFCAPIGQVTQLKEGAAAAEKAQTESQVPCIPFLCREKRLLTDTRAAELVQLIQTLSM